MNPKVNQVQIDKMVDLVETSNAAHAKAQSAIDEWKVAYDEAVRVIYMLGSDVADENLLDHDDFEL